MMGLKRFIGAVCFWVCLAGCSFGARAEAQQSETQTELQQLRADVKRIEARIDALEKTQSGAEPAATGQQVAASVTPVVPVAGSEPGQDAKKQQQDGPEAVKQAEDKGMDTMDAGMGGETISLPYIPQMKFRGFGDVRAFLANQNLAVIGNSPGSPTASTQGGNSTFALGVMDLFITSQISEHFSYLTEMGFEADSGSNDIGVDLERAQLSYVPNDKFSLTMGRSHAMLGYYNTAFHHGTWFQTTIDRPRIFEFEDSGGPLPIHNVGLGSMGKIPSGKLGLHWLAEVGNGKQTYSLGAGPAPANVLADHTGKSTNIGVFARPEKFDGLQAGFDWYQASLVPVVNLLPGFGTPGFAFPNAVNYYKQNIFVAHAVYITPKMELMVEDAEIRDAPRGSARPLYTSGGYAEVSHVFGVVRPYARFQWLNPNFNDPNNAWVGRWVGPTGGVRWDINAFIGLKFEASHYAWKNFSADASGNQLLPLLTKTIEQLGTQMTYTF
jgi:outer membrane murein-binding lipoprotein Lpp